jgi:hypothetical protein
MKKKDGHPARLTSKVERAVRKDAGIKLDGHTSIRCVNSGLTSAALKLGENDIRKGFTFPSVGRVERVERLDVTLVNVL